MASQMGRTRRSGIPPANPNLEAIFCVITSKIGYLNLSHSVPWLCFCRTKGETGRNEWSDEIWGNLIREFAWLFECRLKCWVLSYQITWLGLWGSCLDFTSTQVSGPSRLPDPTKKENPVFVKHEWFLNMNKYLRKSYSMSGNMKQNIKYYYIVFFE